VISNVEIFTDNFSGRIKRLARTVRVCEMFLDLDVWYGGSP